MKSFAEIVKNLELRLAGIDYKDYKKKHPKTKKSPSDSLFQTGGLSSQERNLADKWKGEELSSDAREKLHKSLMKNNASHRKSMADSLSKRVPTKIENGIRHFLLHRGVKSGQGIKDSDSHLETSGVQSFTEDKDIAKGFGKHHSVWVPETHISHVYHSDNQNRGMSDPEKEVIVGPGKFKK